MISVEVKLAAIGIVGKTNHFAENSFVTEINGTIEDAKKYYSVGRIFNMGLWYDSACKEHEDDLMKVVSCELVSEN